MSKLLERRELCFGHGERERGLPVEGQRLYGPLFKLSGKDAYLKFRLSLFAARYVGGKRTYLRSIWHHQGGREEQGRVHPISPLRSGDTSGGPPPPFAHL